MFTGIIEEIGIIKNIKPIAQAKRITIQSKKVIKNLNVDDSISVNGVCLTVVSVVSDSFECEAVEETLKKSTLKFLKSNQKINLERALTLQNRIGGHIVQGHIDTIGKIREIKSENIGKIYTISYPSEYRKYLVQVGSICIDGVSLTLSAFNTNSFEVSIIPHTFENTIFKYYRNGDLVNLEFDLIGKYIENFVNKSETFEEKLNNFLNS
ncbi:MAG: riboflavin synthase [Candidatus Kapabacteria bacterium]|nr:riboflavin synthase [Candidatus Kapabacteria bacterium]